eukprot:SM001293S26274  [mRNA]  locus=s1293:411:1517:+ [translate_table: standard]
MRCGEPSFAPARKWRRLDEILRTTKRIATPLHVASRQKVVNRPVTSCNATADARRDNDQLDNRGPPQASNAHCSCTVRPASKCLQTHSCRSASIADLRYPSRHDRRPSLASLPVAKKTLNKLGCVDSADIAALQSSKFQIREGSNGPDWSSDARPEAASPSDRQPPGWQEFRLSFAIHLTHPRRRRC